MFAFPILRIGGVFVTLWAVALLVESRDRFEAKHSMSVRVGTALFVVGAVLFVLSSSGFVFETYSLATFYQNYQVASVDFTLFPSAMIHAVPTFLSLDFAGMILLGLSYVTLTYRLHDARGRQLIFLGLAATIVTSFFVFSTLFSAASLLGQQWGKGGLGHSECLGVRSRVVRAEYAESSSYCRLCRRVSVLLSKAELF